MALNMGLGFIFSAQDNASTVMNALQRNLRGLEKTAGTSNEQMNKMFGRMGIGMATLGAGLGGLAGTLKLADKAGKLESVMGRVKITTNATVDELQRMQDFALNDAKSFGAGPLQAAAAMEELGSQGLDASRILEKLPTIFKLSTASGMEFAQAAELLQQVMAGYGVDESALVKVGDQLQHVADLSSTKVQDLRIGLARASSAATMMNMNITETLSLYSLLKTTMVSVEKTGTAISTMSARLANPKHRKPLEALGINVLDPLTKETRRIEDILADFYTKTRNLGDDKFPGLVQKVFGAYGTQAISSLVKQMDAGIKGADGIVRKGVEGLYERFYSVSAAKSTLDRAAAIIMHRWDGTVKRLSDTWDSFTTKLGMPFREVWRPVIDRIIGVVEKMTKALDEMNPQAKQFWATAIVVGAALLALAGAFSLIGVVAPIAIGGLVTALEGLGAAFLAVSWELLPLWLALGAGAVVIWAVQKNVAGLGDAWDRFRKRINATNLEMSTQFDYLLDLWADFKQGFLQGLDDIEPELELLGESIDAFGKTLQKLGIDMDLADGPGVEMANTFRMVGRFMAWLIGVTLDLTRRLIDLLDVMAKVGNFMFGDFLHETKRMVRPGKQDPHVPVDEDDANPKVDYPFAHLKRRREAAAARAAEAVEKAKRDAEEKESLPVGFEEWFNKKMGRSASSTSGGTVMDKFFQAVSSRYEGVQPGTDAQANADAIGESVAKALAKSPLIMNMDGQKVGVIVGRVLDGLSQHAVRP